MLIKIPSPAATPKPPRVGLDQLNFCFSITATQNIGISRIHNLEMKKTDLPNTLSGAITIPANTPILGTGTNNNNAGRDDFFVIYPNPSFLNYDTLPITVLSQTVKI